MYANNFFNADPTHILTAKYFTKQVVINGMDNSIYKWDEFVSFRCKPIEPKFNRYTTPNANHQRNAPDTVFIETKWAGIDYTVGDYVEYRDLKYQVFSIKKDETKVNPQVLLLFKNNSNTYYTLELKQISVLDMQKGE